MDTSSLVPPGTASTGSAPGDGADATGRTGAAHLVATVGPAGHGKSALARALAPASCLTLPSGERVALLDTEGQQRFDPAMVSAIGSACAVLFVVAADLGWTAQAQEQLAALDAIGVRHRLLVITRRDLADPARALAQASELGGAGGAGEGGPASFGADGAVAVSAVTGEGLADAAAALGRLAGSLPGHDPCAPVRVWADPGSARAVPAESAQGAQATVGGLVLTGTLPAGTIRVGDQLALTPSMRPVRVQGVRALRPDAAARRAEAAGARQVEVWLTGAGPAGGCTRASALVQPGRWALADVIDVRLAQLGGRLSAQGGGRPRLPRTLTMHLGSASTRVSLRPLSDGLARLTLSEPMPLHVGERVLLRDQATALVAGAAVLDIAPPDLARRGAAASAARELSTWPDVPGAALLLRRHGVLRASTLLAMGVSDYPAPVAGEWLADPGYWQRMAERLTEVVAVRLARDPQARGVSLDVVRATLALPDRRLAAALVRPPLWLRDGVVMLAGAGGVTGRGDLPDAVLAAAQVLRASLAAAPFEAPDADRLRRLGLGREAIAAAERAGLLLAISDQVVLAPGACAQAERILIVLPQPFTAAQARKALHTTRRVAIPLLEYLDRAGVTERLPDDRRVLRATASAAAAAAGLPREPGG